MIQNLFPDPTLESLASDLGRLLIERKQTCAVAESCTGGLIGATITAVAGSSAYFRGGVIAYENDVKIQLLGVSERVLLRRALSALKRLPQWL